MKRVLGIVSVLAMFPTVALAQDSLCFMEWQGKVMDLSNSVCGNSKGDVTTAEEPSPDAEVRVSDVRIEPAMDGTAVEVTGTITNESDEVSSLSLVHFDVINERDGSIVASDAAVVETGAGIEPGEKIAFSKIINKNTLAEEASIPDLRVEVTGSV